MKLYDISLEIYRGMTVYKDKEEKQPKLEVRRSFADGNIYESRICMDLHTGTHLDSPLHVFQEGDSIEKLELKRLITRCRVLDFTYKNGFISAGDFQDKNIVPGEFLLLKTKNSFINNYSPDFVYLDGDGAHYLVRQKVKGVGIDSLGIERGQPDYITHKKLLGVEAIVLEGLKLADVEEGEYILIALPLKIRGAEASPIRAILVKGELTF